MLQNELVKPPQGEITWQSSWDLGISGKLLSQANKYAEDHKHIRAHDEVEIHWQKLHFENKNAGNRWKQQSTVNGPQAYLYRKNIQHLINMWDTEFITVWQLSTKKCRLYIQVGAKSQSSQTTKHKLLELESQEYYSVTSLYFYFYFYLSLSYTAPHRQWDTVHSPIQSTVASSANSS